MLTQVMTGTAFACPTLEMLLLEKIWWPSPATRCILDAEGVARCILALKGIARFHLRRATGAMIVRLRLGNLSGPTYFQFPNICFVVFIHNLKHYKIDFSS
jgi:hypothetical protein